MVGYKPVNLSVILSLICVIGGYNKVVSAGLLSIPAFQGANSETWESFETTYGIENFFLPSPSAVLGTMAIIQNDGMEVYQSANTQSLFGLGTSGIAQTSDGIKGMAVVGLAQTVILDFLAPQLAFGAYWGAWTHPVFGTDPAILNIEFYDSGNQLVGTDSFTYSRSIQHDGLLEWHGWSSDVAFSRIVYSGDYPVIDGLQATTIPEPAVIFPVALAAMLLRRRRS